MSGNPHRLYYIKDYIKYHTNTFNHSPSGIVSYGPVTLDGFAISKNAFLPAAPPLPCLPDVYYEPWEAIAKDLLALIQHRQLRNLVKGLPLLDTDRLITEPEWRRAYVALSYISHAYIWSGETPEEVSRMKETQFLISIFWLWYPFW